MAQIPEIAYKKLNEIEKTLAAARLASIWGLIKVCNRLDLI